ncbi:flagellar hook-basal body protein [Savagea faecisuis]|uniref:Flagellar hook-basal body protein n=1 Tax=Savagea faecisuis TaxID=1274803 RepID=A0ABW3H110_9BACL
MIRTMVTAANTMGQIQQELDIIGHNVANVNTHGYKAEQVSFQEMLYQQFRNDKGDTQAPRQSPLGIRYGVGAMMGHSKVNWKQGALQTTDRTLDFVLKEPKQYFNIQTTNEQAGGRNVYDIVLTRKGNFYAQPENDGTMLLVNEEGHPVLALGDQQIRFDEDFQSLSVKDGGELQIQFSDGRIESHQLQITRVDRPDLMKRLPSGNLTIPDNFDALGFPVGEVMTDLVTPEERGVIGIQQGALEMSNVRLEKELTELINTQRSYQMNARTVTLADQMLGIINNVR